MCASCICTHLLICMHVRTCACTQLRARYVSPDPLQPAKGVLAAAAVRDLKRFVENHVLQVRESDKVCRATYVIECVAHSKLDTGAARIGRSLLAGGAHERD